MLKHISPSALHFCSEVEFYSGISAGVHVYLDPSLCNLDITSLLINSFPLRVIVFDLDSKYLQFHVDKI